jgi:UDP-N-acetylglucosamine/UDP-N-acetyl-alpha-D-glucosaminouronate 4-epimerase
LAVLPSERFARLRPLFGAVIVGLGVSPSLNDCSGNGQSIAEKLREETIRYLVTGGAGFIGSGIVRELARRGESIVVIDDLSTGKERNLEGAVDRVEFHRASITDLEALQRAARGADFVIHLAARTSVPRSVKEPLENNKVNIEGTLKVLIAARDAGVRRLVYAASSSAYGETPTLPKVETMAAAPISPYGVSKFTAELYAQVFTRVYGLETVALRYFNVFGPRQEPGSPYSGVLARFMLALIRNEQPVVYGDGEQSRDFTYIDNVVDATLRACTAPAEVSGRVMNVATGSRVTLNETLRILERLANRTAQPRYEPPRTGDILHSQADIQLARKLLGYEPSVNFEEGLRRTWQWYLSEFAPAPQRLAGS